MNYAELYNEEWKYIKGPLDADWSIKKEGNKIKIRFQGTKSVRDFWQDLKFFEKSVKPFPGCKIKLHTGFWQAYNAIRKELLDECYKLYIEGDEFLIVGHSLGGSMAVICAEDITYHFKVKPTVITWGHPRVTKNSATQKLFDRECFSEDSRFFINGSDVVPRLPFTFWKDCKRTKLGGNFNFFKGWWDVITFKFKYHCSYGNPELYK